jgi:hypothetical protein
VSRPTTEHQDRAAQLLRGEVRDQTWRRHLLAWEILELVELEFQTEMATLNLPHLAPEPMREAIEQVEGLIDLGALDHAERALERAELALIARRRAARQAGARLPARGHFAAMLAELARAEAVLFGAAP